MEVFPISDPQRIFLKKRALSLLDPYSALILKKPDGVSLRYLVMDGPWTDHRRTDHRQGWLHWAPSDKPGFKMRNSIWGFCEKILKGRIMSIVGGKSYIEIQERNLLLLVKNTLCWIWCISRSVFWSLIHALRNHRIDFKCEIFLNILRETLES